MYRPQRSRATSIIAHLSKRTEIIRHVAKFPDHLGVAEIPGRRVATAAKRDRADMAFFARKRLSAHYNGNRVEAFRRLAGRHAVIAGDEGQRNVGLF
jgi:putative heme iron utilization protein